MIRRRLGLGALLAVVALAGCSSSGPSSAAKPGGSGLREPIEGHQTLAATKSEFEQEVRQDPKNKFGWYNLAVIAQSQKDPKAAVADDERAITLDPRFESALYQLGDLRDRAGDYSTAVVFLGRAVAANPLDARAHFDLALALGHRPGADNGNRARSELKKTLALDPALLRATTTTR
jgi:tetratricopeptide (TPR) repeat protein